MSTSTPSLDVLPSMAITAKPVILPGLTHWLYVTDCEPDDSVASYEDYLEGLSKAAS